MACSISLIDRHSHPIPLRMGSRDNLIAIAVLRWKYQFLGLAIRIFYVHPYPTMNGYEKYLRVLSHDSILML